MHGACSEGWQIYYKALDVYNKHPMHGSAISSAALIYRNIADATINLGRKQDAIQAFRDCIRHDRW